MITINTFDEKYFTLDGVRFARIYQPLAQGSQSVGIYSIYDTKQQIINSTKYNEFSINGISYDSQQGVIAALLDVIWSTVAAYDIELLEGRIENLEENQISGVQVYTNYADLPEIGTLLVSYKVSNDSTDSGLNGYYHWDGSVYVKDAELVAGEVAEGSVDAVSGGNVFNSIYSNFINWCGLYDDRLVPVGIIKNGDSAPVAILNHCYLVVEDGVSFGLDVKRGDFVVCRNVSTGFVVEGIVINEGVVYYDRVISNNILNPNEIIEDVSLNSEGELSDQSSNPGVYAVTEFIPWGNYEVLVGGLYGSSAVLQSVAQYSSANEVDFVSGSFEGGGAVESVSKYSGATHVRITYIVANVNQFNYGANVRDYDVFDFLKVGDKTSRLFEAVFKPDIEDTELLGAFSEKKEGVVFNELYNLIDKYGFTEDVSLNPTGGLSDQSSNPGVYAVTEFIPWGNYEGLVGSLNSSSAVLQSVAQYSAANEVDFVSGSFEGGGAVESVSKYSGATHVRITYIVVNVDKLNFGSEVFGLTNLLSKYGFTEDVSLNSEGELSDQSSNPGVYAVTEFIPWGNYEGLVGGLNGVKALLQSVAQYSAANEVDFVSGSFEGGGVVESVSKYSGATHVRITYIVANVNQFNYGSEIGECERSSGYQTGQKDFAVFRPDLTGDEFNEFINNKIGVVGCGASGVGAIGYDDSFRTDFVDFIGYGQSLMMGARTYKPITLANYPDTYMVGSRVPSLAEAGYDNDGAEVFNPLLSTVGTSWFAEQPITSAVTTFKRLFDRFHRLGYQKKFVASACGHGGFSIEQLSKACTNTDSETTADNVYNLGFIKHLIQAKNSAVALGETISAPFILYMQGESNYSGTGKGLTPGSNQVLDKDGYKALLLQLKNDMQADVVSYFDQSEKPIFCIYQTSSDWIANKEQEITQAQIEFSEENEDVILFNPYYAFPKTEDNHMTSNGIRCYGSLSAKNMYEFFIQGKQDLCVRFGGVNIVDSQVLIDFVVPVPPLVFEVDFMEEIYNNGFKVYVDDVEKKIRDIKIVGGSRVVLTMYEKIKIQGSIIEVTYADDSVGGKGNLRDSDSFNTMYNYYDDSDTQVIPDQPIYQPKNSDGEEFVTTLDRLPCWNWAQHIYYKETII